MSINQKSLNILNCMNKKNASYLIKKKAAHSISRLIMYVILISLTFIFLHPFILMLIYGTKPSSELQDASLVWLSRHPTLQLIAEAYKVLDYPKALWNTVLLAVIPTIGHILSASMVGYGFARLKIKGKNILFMLVLLTLIVPTQTIVIPMYKQYMMMGWLRTGFLPLIVPSFFGMGLKGALYIFIYRQSFAALPVDLENAARIDGCGVIRTFVRVMFPLAGSATLVIAILSIVWRWNDYVEPQVYITNNQNFTLPMLLPSYWQQYNTIVGGSVENFNVTQVMSSALLMLLPMIVFYLIIQKRFMQGIETTGIVG